MLEVGLERRGPCKGTAFFLFFLSLLSHIFFLVQLINNVVLALGV